jgi:hypothetical protein
MDKTIIIVGSLPRCRTAWLSELLTIHGQSFAFHEAMNGCDFVDKWAHKLMARPEPIVIDCNPNFWGSAPRLYEIALKDLYPGVTVKYVFIHRKLEECFDSFMKNFGELMNLPADKAEECFRMWHFNMADMEILQPNLSIQYNSIDESCQQILEWCGLPFDPERVSELQKKIVVQNIPEVMRRYA